MRIVIDHIARIEGHAGFIGKIVNGKIAEAKIETQEGARLFESLLIGRHYFDAPVITARICGVCPVIHMLTSIKAIENAFGIDPHPLTVTLRQLMLAGQTIQSHTLHLYFLVLADYFNADSGIEFAQKYPEDAKEFLALRDFGNRIVEIIGGRTIHPLTPKTGGFTKLPDTKKLAKLSAEIPQNMAAAKKLLNIISNVPLPEFSRSTNYVAMRDNIGYLPYEGLICSTQNHSMSAEKFIKTIRETETIHTPSKRAKIHSKGYLVGALSRINLNSKKLNQEAAIELKKLNVTIPCFNSFYNNIAQAIEIIHLIEEAKVLLDEYLSEINDLGINEINNQFKPKTSYGVGALEAPRGTLFHAYKFNREGLIVSTNIITPTVQSIANLEEDLKVWLKTRERGSQINIEEEKKAVMKLIRAYDPCITCATH
ncbi:Ni/Fe hydrogenase subunit alpha [Patescibacteria group bacterium]|nr:Ni/Fe hydrogenase subunit alpha [Patescibacteria group bacterium]MBU4580229.1 Ni/Fe hydrogenase subunit alpha [Patescibacteria group bacterium]